MFNSSYLLAVLLMFCDHGQSRCYCPERVLITAGMLAYRRTRHATSLRSAECQNQLASGWVLKRTERRSSLGL